MFASTPATVSPFIQAMDGTNHRQLGEKGAAEFSASGVEESRVALFFALVRDIPSERLHELLRMVMKDGKKDPEITADLFIMAFQTRFCRGGKGERDLFYRMITELAVEYPETTASAMAAVPHYGSYKDWFQILYWARDEAKTPSDEGRRAMVPITNTILNLARDQLLKDQETLDQHDSKNGSKPSTPNISLLAKWAPREGKALDKLAKELANRVFPNSKAPKKEYRKLLSRLNASLNTVEVKMSSKHWDTIDFASQVPSVSLMKHRKAFLNEVVRGAPPGAHEDATGNRHPTDDARVTCRKRLRRAMLDKIKGKQLFPHEIVKKLREGRQLSTVEKDLFSCQWDDIRRSVLEDMKKESFPDDGVKEKKEGNNGLTVDLGKMVSLVDVSGSMMGTPMEVSIALGLLVSEVSSPTYANRCLTFTSAPEWVELDTDMSLDEKVKKLSNAPWGCSTNFEAAMEQILQVAVRAKLNPEDIPNLIVFSDMQFDEARGCRGYYYGRGGEEEQISPNVWETHHERIVRRFAEEGIKACGKAWPAPHMIYWNLRGDTNGFPAQADTPGVTMLSGYSPSLMKLLLSGEPIEEEEVVVVGEDGQVERKKVKPNPFTTVRKALDSDDFDQVREVLYASNEGALKGYIKEAGLDEILGKADMMNLSPEKKDTDWEMIE